MSKPAPSVDVLVLGEHPSAYLAAELLLDMDVSVVHCTIPTEQVPERLVLVNAQFFGLHKPLEKLKKKLTLSGVWGVNFLADDGSTKGEYKCKNPSVFVGRYSELRKAICQQAKEAGAKLLTPKSLQIRILDQQHFEVHADSHVIRPKAVLLAGALPPEQAKALSLPEMFASEVMRRYTFVRLRGQKWFDPAPKPCAYMSLDLGGKLTWAWMLIAEDEAQLAVEHPLDQPEPTPAALVRSWATVLMRHGVLKTIDDIGHNELISLPIPSAGALAREVVGNRTLLFGPAGGFYTACLEDIFPNCWSARFACEAVKAALNQTHLQDSLQPYRESWGTTLGEYLRGPQQNLRFLLPLVYRNPVMTSRLAESILQGKAVVR
jgi:flavin-dependent dehydrogenase